MLTRPEIVLSITDARDDAASAGLRYVLDARPGIRRQRIGAGFVYRAPDGSRISDPRALGRIRALAIPPAWADVWICPSANGHVQATGRDARRRKQYRYHPRFREVREGTKYEHMIAFAMSLSAIRQRLRKDMARPGLPREKVLGTVVHLLDSTLIRVGNDDYARQNKSYGLTTLKNRHAEVDGTEVRFHFTGKSGRQWSARVKDRRVARIIKACQELPGQELLQYLDEDGRPQDVTSSDVNEYLREITGRDATAKDFRTWAGTVLAAVALQGFDGFSSAAEAKRNVRAAIANVAKLLGNTPTICRKCYVHPDILSSYLAGRALKLKAIKVPSRTDYAGLKPEEAAVLGMLLGRPDPAPRRGVERDGARASGKDDCVLPG